MCACLSLSLTHTHTHTLSLSFSLSLCAYIVAADGKGDDGGLVARDVVLAARLQVPAVALLELSEPRHTRVSPDVDTPHAGTSIAHTPPSPSLSLSLSLGTAWHTSTKPPAVSMARTASTAWNGDGERFKKATRRSARASDDAPAIAAMFRK
jgi:hypothetical protein